MSIKPILKSADKLQAAMEFAKPKAAEGETARLNANIKVELHRALKMKAAAERTTIGNLIEEWIESWAKK